MQLTNTEILRRAVKKSRRKPFVLARDVGIAKMTLWRFVNGADIHFSTADKLAAYFGLTLQPDAGAGSVAPKGKPKGKPVKNVAALLSAEKARIRANRAATKKATK